MIRFCTLSLSSAILNSQKYFDILWSNLIAVLTKTPTSACAAPPIMLDTKHLWPGASRSVNRFCSVSKNPRPTSTVLPLSRSSSLVSKAHDKYLKKIAERVDNHTPFTHIYYLHFPALDIISFSCLSLYILKAFISYFSLADVDCKIESSQNCVFYSAFLKWLSKLSR